MTDFFPSNIQGAGICLRSQHYQTILQNKPKVNWFEVLSDNYLMEGGQALDYLEKIREYYPVTLHGVGLSLGSADPLNMPYLARLKKLADWIQPAHISDHLAWVSISGQYLHDLIPLPYTESVLNHVANRITHIQDFLGQAIAIENPSSYLSFKESTIPEWEFIQNLVDKTKCYLLIDVNNIYVSAINHGFDAETYLNAIPIGRVKEIHLAGYENREKYLFDTHGYRVHPPVWTLYKKALKRLGSIPTLIEWDTNIPTFEVLKEEANKAQKEIGKYLKK
jgi:uncharacterized protein (UPF0276 family)